MKNLHVPDSTWQQYAIDIKHSNGKFLVIDKYIYNLIFKNVIENTYESAKKWLCLYEEEEISTDGSAGEVLGNNIIYALLLPTIPYIVNILNIYI